MGLCASVDAASAAPAQQTQARKDSPKQLTVETQAEHKPAVAPPASPAEGAQLSPAKPSTQSGVGNAVASMDDDEYRSQIKSIFLFILDRLLQTMEYERDAMHQLASLRSPGSPADSASYLTLFGADRVEHFIRNVFDLSNVSMPSRAAAANADRNTAEQNFILLVKGAQQVAEGGPKIARAELTNLAKEVCTAAQTDLRAASATLDANKSLFRSYADLAAHFAFFMRTLNFTQGDIANDAQLLERNVEDIISATA